MIRLQGPAILLNLFFGTKVNAAYGIAYIVSTNTATLSTAMVSALSPEITAREGRGDRAKMLDFALRACKFGTLMVMVFAIPLMFEMDYVLKLWLREPPEYTTVFCKFMLLMLIVDHLTIGYIMAVNAGGKIAAYMLTLGIISASTVLLAWFFLKLGFAPTSVGVAIVITYALCSIGRVLWARHLFQTSIWQWVTNVVFSCGIVAAGATFFTVCPRWFIPPSFARFLISTLASVITTGTLGWFIVLNSQERLFLIQNTVKVIRKTLGWRENLYIESAEL
jgi:O-antigen/teichoic acid export membrane protein